MAFDCIYSVYVLKIGIFTIWNSYLKPKYIISIGDIKENRNSELSVIGPLAFYGGHLLLFSCCQIGSLGDY